MPPPLDPPLPTILIHNRYRLLTKLGSGGFATVHLAKDTLSPALLAIKLEPSTSPHLPREAHLLTRLSGHGIPHVRSFTREGTFSALVMDLLGPSLQNLVLRCKGRRFGMKTVLMLGRQLLERLEHVHGRGVVHRDLKPDNILMGVGKGGGVVHLVDFGLAKEKACGGWDGKSLMRRGFDGTLEFASITAHLSYEQTYKDDIESLSYVLIYLATSTLPWLTSHTPPPPHDIIGQQKISLSPEEVAKGLPIEFAEHLRYARSLRPGESVDYAALSEMYTKLFERLEFQDDGVFDWTPECAVEGRK